MHEKIEQIIPKDPEYWSRLMVVKRTVKAIAFGSLFGYMTGQFTDSQLMIFTGAILGVLSSEFVISPLAWKAAASLYTKK